MHQPEKPVYQLPLDTRATHSPGCCLEYGLTYFPTLDRDGELWLGTRKIEKQNRVNEHQQWISKEHRQNSPVYITADKNLPMREIQGLLAELSNVGFYRFNFEVTEGKKPLLSQLKFLEWDTPWGIFQQISFLRAEQINTMGFYVPALSDCDLCVENAVMLTPDDSIFIIDLNSRSAKTQTEKEIAWPDIPNRISRLMDLNPTTHIPIVIDESMSYGEFIEFFCGVYEKGAVNISLLPPHHRF